MQRPSVAIPAALVCAGMLGSISPVAAQGGVAKPRLELADSSRAAGPRRDAPRTKAPPPPDGRQDFVRAQTVLGAVIYAPAFATIATTNPIAWGANYVVVAGGTYLAAREVSRSIAVTDPMQELATWMPVNGAIAGALAGSAMNADDRGTAATIFAGSLGAAAISLWRGRGMNTGEATSTILGSDLGGLTAWGAATFAGLTRPGADARARLAVTAGGMLLGAPLGHAYAALASYNVTRGDLLAMTASAGTGMLAGLAVIADNDHPGEREYAGALTFGGLAGLLAGDLLLARRYDHTDGEGTLMIGGGIAGGLMGAGVALLSGGSHTRWSRTTAAFTAAGAAAGIAWSQYYLKPKADGTLRLGALEFDPLGALGAATRAPGVHTLAAIRF